VNRNILNSILRKILYILSIFCFFVYPQNAFAYLDLNTGSYLLQLLLGGFFGFVFVINIFSKKIKAFYNKIFHKKKKHNLHE